MGITHFDDAPGSPEFDLGHLRGKWTYLGEAAGSRGVGVRRIQVPAGGWSTPAHEHGADEEIFYVLAGSGISWQAGRTATIAAGDCIVYHPKAGAHTVHATGPLDLLAFGTRSRDEAVGFPRLGMSLVNGRFTVSEQGTVDGAPLQFVRESQIGPPELAAQPGERPPSIVNVDAVEPQRTDRARVRTFHRDLGAAAGSIRAGINHIEVDPGHESSTLHCHSLEEELFIVLEGDGVLVLGSRQRDYAQTPVTETETPVTPGTVISRPPGTGVGHTFRAGPAGLTLLAYGTREPNDITFYPRSNKIAFRGIGVIGRLQHLDYWDGED